METKKKDCYIQIKEHESIHGNKEKCGNRNMVYKGNWCGIAVGENLVGQQKDELERCNSKGVEQAAKAM